MFGRVVDYADCQGRLVVRRMNWNESAAWLDAQDNSGVGPSCYWMLHGDSQSSSEGVVNCEFGHRCQKKEGATQGCKWNEAAPALRGEADAPLLRSAGGA